MCPCMLKCELTFLSCFSYIDLYVYSPASCELVYKLEKEPCVPSLPFIGMYKPTYPHYLFVNCLTYK